MARYSDAFGNGTMTTRALQSHLTGRTLQLELAAPMDGQWFDSNVVSVAVQ